MKTRQIGKFIVDGFFFKHLDTAGDGANLFAGMVVLDVHHDYVCDRRTYRAVHPHFRPIGEGEMIPEYQAIFVHGSIFPVWVELKPFDRRVGDGS